MNVVNFVITELNYTRCFGNLFKSKPLISFRCILDDMENIFVDLGG